MKHKTVKFLTDLHILLLVTARVCNTCTPGNTLLVVISWKFIIEMQSHNCLYNMLITVWYVECRQKALV